MKKRVVFIAAACVILLAAVLSIPFWPKSVELNMHCVEITQDGTVLNTGTFMLKGWRSHNDDSFDHFTLTDMEVLGLNVLPQGKDAMLIMKQRQGTPYDSIEGWGYTTEQVFCGITLGPDNDWCLIKVDEQLFVASTEADFDPAVILEACAAFFG